MEEIKQHLESGKTVKELKELGYKAPSIYKVKKQMKDNSIESTKPQEPQEPPEPFQEVKKPPEVEEVPATILVGDNPGPNNSDPDPDNIHNNPKTENESLTEELFGDDEQPFQDFNEVVIDRDHVDVSAPGRIYKPETKGEDPGSGKLGAAELITQIYSLIGITTGHEHWDVSPKEQKVLKHLCKIPALESALHKFGLYGCVISLITMTLKRIKIEMQLKKESAEDEYYDQGNEGEVIVRPDSPGTVMGLLDK